MLAYQPIDTLPNCFRLLIINPAVTAADLDRVLAEIDRHGRAIVNDARAPSDPPRPSAGPRDDP